MAAERSARPFVEELPRILDQRGLSRRQVALQAGITPAHLSRVLNRADGKVPSPDLTRRVAVALTLPDDYFPEYRVAVILNAMRRDPTLRDRVYDQINDKRTR